MSSVLKEVTSFCNISMKFCTCGVILALLAKLKPKLHMVEKDMAV